jgi:hypothetical protein
MHVAGPLFDHLSFHQDISSAYVAILCQQCFPSSLMITALLMILLETYL